MKKLYFLFFLVSIIFSQSISFKIDELIKNKYFEYTNIGIKVVNLSRNNQILYQKNNKMLFRPASNMKILTTAVALDLFGIDYKFQTILYTDGKIHNGTLGGNLCLKSEFDPSLKVKNFENLVNQLKNKGLKKIEGDLLIDVSNIDTLEWNRDWAWDDEPNYYAAHISSISLNGNCIDISVKPSKIGKNPDVFLYPNYTNLNIINNAITVDTNQQTNLTITRDWYYRNNTIIINGKISLKDAQITETVNFEKPHKQILMFFYQLLVDNGIEVKGQLNVIFDNNKANQYTILAADSTDIKDIIKNFNKVSDNLTGEMLLRCFANKIYNEKGSSLKGIEVVKGFIKKIGLDSDNYQIIDGSGLAPTNYINNELIIAVLINLYNDKLKFPIFYESLPIAGVDGTLRRRMKDTPAFNNVRAKTGTINGVSSLSGYVKAKNGDMLAFSIFIQNHLSQAKARAYQDEICNILATCEL
ncbi:MAG TPA: D-alanyl-D-alanine carboxypeptidase/D-alanyl-D-alanine-endopeptidase [Ignavibacteriales bacterium]|nr:D-alanyl-D-alanine carboxypeptidase/D-alanyl-D-alanine-endopeptidase [Ignavibacteriales bacterium]HOL80383.1 D-alanyl-D-alanine carboxypeptidase/D-alanyl-D-alanine-endopeptidase [Ignavibacteriales bacterium]HOM64834.1 D-alanyl-D-alanine carboxypeptidase/D-alanyl-D-alanine-endopeptidase [Ignavibacteriales bacterium]HPD67433.1 D-alanyl-D-alanine carboxypeptidase/D-alanyl-D-alanine-endopeptidase [Ignavibacteriales bacterium]HPP32572.1 D-alanyl-D-alanine carboxypeptidase/D-alanyl-D-alanine-endop